MKYTIFLVLVLFISNVWGEERKKNMENRFAMDKIVVSKTSFESDDQYDIINSNLQYLNALFKEHVRHDEVSQDALLSYWVDYYTAQVRASKKKIYPKLKL